MLNDVMMKAHGPSKSPGFCEGVKFSPKASSYFALASCRFRDEVVPHARTAIASPRVRTLRIAARERVQIVAFNVLSWTRCAVSRHGSMDVDGRIDAISGHLTRLPLPRIWRDDERRRRSIPQPGVAGSPARPGSRPQRIQAPTGFHNVPVPEQLSDVEPRWGFDGDLAPHPSVHCATPGFEM